MVAKIVSSTTLLLRQHAPEQITTNLIAEKAGVSKGSIYQYFADKE
ncbi:TetR/AcrR family transcriptional regulator, partial [Mycobacterium kansasii]